MRNKSVIIILSIILIGLFLRLWNFPNLFYFAIDEEKAAYIITQITQGKHLPTVGHPSSIGFRLGPLLYYFIAPFYKLFGPNPIVWGYLSVFASIISMYLIYQIGKKLNKITGIFALILYSFSYLNILYDRRGWQLSFHSLIALTILFSLLKIKENKTNFFYLLTVALIAASQFEVATLLFIPTAFISLLILKLKLNKKALTICFLLFFLSQVGLFLFDIKHNFMNTKYLINYFRPGTVERINTNIPLTNMRAVYLAHNLIPSTLARTISVFSPSNVAIQYANCPIYLSYKQTNIPLLFKFMPILILILFAISTIKNWQSSSDISIIQKTIFVYFGLLFGGITIYTYIFNGEMAEYYLLGSFAYFFIVIASILGFLFRSRGKIIILILLFLFIVDNSNHMFTSQNPYGLNHKLDAINYSLSKVGNNSFILESFQTCWYSGGYRYLYTLKKHDPLQSYMDQYLNEYYNPDKKVTTEYQVIVLTPELIGNNPSGFDKFRNEINSSSLFKKQFGTIEIYINKINR
ncbi:glycosyltransferase family 39 protein [Candidatus Gottesmanbacteria bacterium]|nr:glycosyltransferase family 39 protein [Candidatus Gottesmanbacteria bacterium]